MIPPIRNARIYWRPHRGHADPGGFYPVCLEPACNGLSAWGTRDAGHETGEDAARWLLDHRKSRHTGAPELSVGELTLGGESPRYLYNPADLEPGAP